MTSAKSKAVEVLRDLCTINAVFSEFENSFYYYNELCKFVEKLTSDYTEIKILKAKIMPSNKDNVLIATLHMGQIKYNFLDIQEINKA